MKQTLGLQVRQEQRLTLAPQMIQRIEILQLPLLALQERIDQELEENPVLELKAETEEEEHGRAETETVEASEQAEDSQTDDEILQKANRLDDEWYEYFSQSTRPRRDYSDEKDPKLEALENTPAPTISLHEHLMNQLSMSSLTGKARKAAEFLIANIDSNGYLRCSLEDVPKNVPGATIADAEKALNTIQEMEPPGVGARDLVECLLLQLDERDPNYELLRDLVENHLEDVEKNKLPDIAKSLNTDIETVKELIHQVATLNPHPGRLYDSEPTRYVVPDITVERRDGEFVIIPHDDTIPQLRISRMYRQMLSDKRTDPNTRDFIQKRVQSAQWLIDSIEQRKETLYRVTKAIVEHQKDFLEHGPGHLKPLKMQEIADKVHVHVSTVSRAISGKYIQTPQGVFEMKTFFTGGKATDEGEVESWDAVREKLKEIIENEDKRNPYSDEELVRKLKEETGMEIARRTIAKYRKHLRIPSSRKRKQY